MHGNRPQLFVLMKSLQKIFSNNRSLQIKPGIGPAQHKFHGIMETSRILEGHSSKWELVANKRRSFSPHQRKKMRPIRLANRPPANSTFLSQQTSHQQSANITFLSEQISTSHQPPAKPTRAWYYV
jgi:hypothetical protein